MHTPLDSNPLLIRKFMFKHAAIYVLKNSENIVIVEAISNYIPIDKFKEIFNAISKLAETEAVNKLIFDKRNLTVFHQPSMEWYFVEWKERMFEKGLSIHRKILPNDETFRESVKIGREKISRTFPDGKYTRMDIAYAESLEEAISQ